VACIEFPFLLITFGFLGFLAVGMWSLMVIGPIAFTLWLMLTRQRRSRIRHKLAGKGWPPILLSPDLLVFPDGVWRRLPRYDDMAVIPSFAPRGGTRALLWKTLQFLENLAEERLPWPLWKVDPDTLERNCPGWGSRG
jgi:hypothetical protein